MASNLAQLGSIPKEECWKIGELVSDLRHRARDASRVLSSAPLDRPPNNNNNITELLPLDRGIPTDVTVCDFQEEEKNA